MDELTLQPGQTVVVSITKHLTYRITHTGWVLEVKSTGPIIVRPTDRRSVVIASGGEAEEDEV